MNQRATTHIDKRIGRIMRSIRYDRRLSQAAVAEALGLSHQQVQKYEAGTDRLSVSRLMAFCNATGVAPAKFFDMLNVEGVPGEGEV
jgi:transcriptional regulator with XRE-family HTH domain